MTKVCHHCCWKYQ